MSITLAEFEHQLAAVIGRSTDLRPFVCEGSPLNCEVFIVGYNPATKMVGDWWRFWKQGYGYQKSLWFNEYLAQRRETSKTRAKIEEIVGSLAGVRVLEANIDARPSERKSEYPRPVTRPFDYVLSVCRPRVVVAHGTDAVEHLQSWSSKGVLIACEHFIYVGRQRTAEILAETRRALANRGDGAGVVAIYPQSSNLHKPALPEASVDLGSIPSSEAQNVSPGKVVASLIGNSAALREAARGLDAILEDSPSLSLEVRSSQLSIWFYGKKLRLFRLKLDGLKADLLFHRGFVERCPDLENKFDIVVHKKNPNLYRFASGDPVKVREIISRLRSVIHSYR